MAGSHGPGFFAEGEGAAGRIVMRLRALFCQARNDGMDPHFHLVRLRVMSSPIRSLTATLRSLTATLHSLTATLHSLTATLHSLTATLRSLTATLHSLTALRSLTATLRSLTVTPAQAGAQWAQFPVETHRRTKALKRGRYGLIGRGRHWTPACAGVTVRECSVAVRERGATVRERKGNGKGESARLNKELL
jgi:hypothetical protein